MPSKNIKNAILMSVIVGTVLNIINNFDALLKGNLETTNGIKICLTYLTPFLVSLFSAHQATKTSKN